MIRSQFSRYINPVINALRELGGSGRPSEVGPIVARELNLPEEVLEERIRSGQSKFDNQVAWARFYLVKEGYIDSSRHGVWALTEKGRNAPEFSDDQINDLVQRVQGLSARSKIRRDSPDVGRQVPRTDGDSTEDESPDPDSSYREQLLATLKSVSASGFERLCQRLLREAGFEQVTVTGRSGDGGIDGIGLLQLNPFVSFKVLFQCKRYDGSVGPTQIRDFRGAMQGRADKGIILTTGTFSTESRREAVRDGVPPIELVDGERLIEMFESLELGLLPRTTYDVSLKFFDEFRE
jgi:restriction system protein